MISLEAIFASPKDVRLEKETFGPVLRAARERRGVTLRQLAAETKLSVELWEALEENNLARWPKRVFARSYVRDYAERIGLDPDEVVNEFCRLFPNGAIGVPSASSARRPKSSRTISRGKTCRPRRTAGPATAPRARRPAFSDAIEPASSRSPSTRLSCWASAISEESPASATGRRPPLPAWPYSSFATFFTGRTFGLVASEWICRTLQSLPGTRRQLSSRTENA